MKQFDFEADIIDEIQKLSAEMGFKVSKHKPWNKMLTDYLTVRMKIIEPRPRKIDVNPDFILYGHPKEKEILKIMQMAGKGDNLNRFQSKKLFQTNFHDHLQSEWNIYHFHLSLDNDTNSYFMKQGNLLLFAFIDDERIIFLGTDTHKDGIFADTKWIEVLHVHFPEAIDKYRDEKIKDVFPEVNAVERQMLWNKGYTIALTKVKDVVYHSPGVGRSTTGRSLSVTLTTDKIMRWVFKVKEQLNDSYDEICRAFGIDTHQADFKMMIGDKTFELIELSSKSSLLEFPELFSFEKV